MADGADPIDVAEALGRLHAALLRLLRWPALPDDLAALLPRDAAMVTGRLLAQAQAEQPDAYRRAQPELHAHMQRIGSFPIALTDPELAAYWRGFLAPDRS